MKFRQVINEETLQDIINIETGLLYPLNGFMMEKDFRSVIDNYTMDDGQVFTIPVTLDVDEILFNNVEIGEKIELIYHSEVVACIITESKYDMTDEDILKVFCTLEDAHPGVLKEKNRSRHRIGGQTS